MIKGELDSFNDTSIAFASKSDKELRYMRFLFQVMNWEYLTKIGTNFVKSALKFKVPLHWILKKTLFNQFCGGETLADCQKPIHELCKFNIKTILDYSVEGQKIEENFDANFLTIEKMIAMDAASACIAFSVVKVSSITSIVILEKMQQGIDLDPEELISFEKSKEKLEKICQKAMAENIKLLIDAEESWLQGSIDALVYAVMSKYNTKSAVIFNTYQMYRADMLYLLMDAIADAKSGGYFLGVKLVRGAYMDKEKERALENDYVNPIFETKKETDASFNNALGLCVENIHMLELCCGSHNEESNLRLTQLMHKKNIAPNDGRIYFAQLYGMGEHISYNLASREYNTAKYLPFGPLEEVLPYLFRRADENKSMSGQTSRELSLINKEIQRRKSIKQL